MTGISRRSFVTAAGLTAAGAALAACSSKDDKGKTNASSNKPLEKVTYLTGYGILGRESYVVVADKKGYFRENGIEVTIQPGQAGAYNHNQLLAGTVQFAAVDGSGQIIRNAKAEKPADKNIRIISAVNQLTLTSVITWADKGYTSPKDLEGKLVGVGIGAASKTLFPAYARLAGVDDKKLRWQEVAPPQLPSLLLTNKVDALATFHPGAAAIERSPGGKKMQAFPYSDYLSDLYGTVTVTTVDMINKKPELVRGFNSALMRGLKFMIDHPADAANMLKEFDKTQNVDSSVAEINIMKPYVTTSGGAPVGTFDNARMAKNIAVLQGLGLMPAGLTPEQIGDLNFLPKSDS